MASCAEGMFLVRHNNMPGSIMCRLFDVTRQVFLLLSHVCIYVKTHGENAAYGITIQNGGSASLCSLLLRSSSEYTRCKLLHWWWCPWLWSIPAG